MIHKVLSILTKLAQYHQKYPQKISHIPTEVVTESSWDSKSKENTDIPQLSDNPTIPSIPANSNTPQLVNIVDKLSTNKTTGKLQAQLTITENMKSLISIKN